MALTSPNLAHHWISGAPSCSDAAGCPCATTSKTRSVRPAMMRLTVNFRADWKSAIAAILSRTPFEECVMKRAAL